MSATRTAIYWRGYPVLSFATNQARDGQQDAYIGLRRIDSHEHVWVNIPSNLSSSGQRFKDSSEHVGSETSLAPNGLFARARLEWPAADTTPPLVQLAHVNGDTSHVANGVAAPSVSRSAQSIDLGLPKANAIEVDCVFLPKAAASEWTAGPVVPWSESALWSIGIAVRDSAKQNVLRSVRARRGVGVSSRMDGGSVRNGSIFAIE